MEAKKTLEIRQMNANRPEKLVMMDAVQEDIENHDHHFFELAYVTGGEAVHMRNGKQSTLHAGDYFIMDYGNVHRYEQCKSFTLINCLFLPELIDETLCDCKSLEVLLQRCLIRYYRMVIGRGWTDRIFHDEDGRIGQLLSGMVAEYRNQKLGSLEIFRCRLTEILILTLRLLVQGDRYPENTLVTELIRYVDLAYQDRLTLQVFCKQKHYSLPYVSRLFKQETGMTFREYLQKVRMEKCCELLSGSDLTITEAARAVGYEDLQFFHDVFRRYLHMTPREYRRLEQG